MSSLEEKFRELAISPIGGSLDGALRVLYQTMISKGKLLDIMKEQPFR